MIVYVAKCIVNNKQYVGQTAYDLAIRWRDHKTAAAAGSQMLFHKAIRKYGLENFHVCEIARASSLQELDVLEICFIKELGTLEPNGYNQAEGGRNNRKGVKASEETRARLRAAWVRRKQKFGMPVGLIAHQFKPGQIPHNKGKRLTASECLALSSAQRKGWTLEVRAAQSERARKQLLQQWEENPDWNNGYSMSLFRRKLQEETT